ncbi:MAG: hypothetical protein AAF268_11615 [Cyanobacteria bacterium P01_A01_bin.3]
MLEILSIKPPDPEVVALKQAQTKSARSRKQDNNGSAPSNKATEASDNTTKPAKRKLLPGNGLHSWRARLVAQAIAIDEERNAIQFRLQDGLEVWLKRHFRKVTQGRWRSVSAGSYYKLSLYPWMRDRGREFYSGCVYGLNTTSEEEFINRPEEWHLVGCFTGNVFLVERDVTRVSPDKSPRRITIIPKELDKHPDIPRGCCRASIHREDRHIVLNSTPIIETKENALKQPFWPLSEKPDRNRHRLEFNPEESR